MSGSTQSSSSSFRLAQTIADLRSFAGRAKPATLARIAAAVPGAGSGDTLSELVHSRGALLEEQHLITLYPALLLAATLPEDDFDGFLTATSILLADRLQHGAGTDDLHWHDEAHRQNYCLAPVQIRAVLLAAFAQLERMGRVTLATPVEPRDLIVLRQDDVLARLWRMASGAKGEAVSAIASTLPMADDRAGVRSRIRFFLQAQQTPSFNVASQADPLRLALDHAIDAPEGMGFALATALTLMDALANSDGAGRAAAFWASHGASLSERRDPTAETVFSALRHLYEASLDWSPPSGTVAIPWIPS